MKVEMQTEKRTYTKLRTRRLTIDSRGYHGINPASRLINLEGCQVETRKPPKHTSWALGVVGSQREWFGLAADFEVRPPPAPKTEVNREGCSFGDQIRCIVAVRLDPGD